MKRAVGTILALALCLQLTGCKTILKREEGEKESTVPQLESVQLERLSYKVPAEWRRVKDDTRCYHYPTQENKAGYFFLFYSDRDVSSAADTEALYGVYDAVLEGMEKGAVDFHLNKKERVKLAGVEALKVNYTERVDPYGVYTIEAYIFAGPDKEAMYFAIFTMGDALKEEMSAQITPITDSFHFSSRGIGWGQVSGGGESGGSSKPSSSAAAGDGTAGGSQGTAGNQGGGSHAGASSSGQSGSTQSGAGQSSSKPGSNSAQSSASQSGGNSASSGATAGQKNALSTAKSYLSISDFSHKGLVEQLEYEGFSHEEAVYGADHCGANWNAQALKGAKSYLEVAAFSQKGLAQQLQYDGYTGEQAAYGAANCGANWNEQAAKSAKSYLEISPHSRQGLIDQLKYEGFTEEQAVYGVSAVGL
ncbi:Ltp family lipoprotein [Bittarella sp. HCP28S3_D9]|uniref:Ltp family lipoprotein n=1 Tax=Bittarella sp. HCP28S3_D9 TaxID=3440253 RepID=UPI003F8B7F98